MVSESTMRRRHLFEIAVVRLLRAAGILKDVDRYTSVLTPAGVDPHFRIPNPGQLDDSELAEWNRMTELLVAGNGSTRTQEEVVRFIGIKNKVKWIWVSEA